MAARFGGSTDEQLTVTDLGPDVEPGRPVPRMQEPQQITATCPSCAWVVTGVVGWSNQMTIQDAQAALLTSRHRCDLPGEPGPFVPVDADTPDQSMWIVLGEDEPDRQGPVPLADDDPAGQADDEPEPEWDPDEPEQGDP